MNNLMNFALPQGVPATTGAQAVTPPQGVGVPSGTITFVMPDGSVISLVEWIDDKLFGTVELQNGDSSEIEGLGVGRSQQVPGGTRNQTRVDSNIPRGGDNGLPNGYEMYVYSIGVSCARVMRPNTSSAPAIADSGTGLSDPPAHTTLWKINRLMYLYFEYNGAKMAEGDILDFPSGRGFWFGGTANNVNVVTNSAPSPRNRGSMVLPVRLQPNNAFKMIFNPVAALSISQTASDNSTALEYADFRTTLYGLVKKPIHG